MKKKGFVLISLLTGLMLISVGVDWAAALVQDNVEVNIGTATVTGTLAADMTVNIKDVIGNGAATEINWTGATAGSTDWLVADQYAEIDATSNYPGYGIQVYTNNTATTTAHVSTADPTFTGIGSPAGLVGVSDTTVALPMALIGKDDLWGTTAVPLEDAGIFTNGYIWQADA
ncbi:hypothetical protein KAU39_08750, partial [bacterium]|nr:hypothetical protein [bacterium]